MAAPSIRDLMARGLSASQASEALYGGVGANSDLRNWDAILNSGNVAAAARSGLNQMYTTPGLNQGNSSYTRPDYKTGSGYVGVTKEGDAYLRDAQGNALTHLGRGGIAQNNRAGEVFGMDVAGDLKNLGFSGTGGAVGDMASGNYLLSPDEIASIQSRSGGGSSGGGDDPAQGIFHESAYSSGPSTSRNPYLDQMAAGITQQTTRNLNENILPQLRSRAIATGGYGGSRQGIAEGLAVGRTNDALTNALANLYGNNFEQEQSRSLQRYGMDQGYDINRRNVDLNYANLDRNIANDNRNWQMQGAQFGLGLQDRMLQQGNLGLGLGGQIQNTPMNYWQQFGNQYNSIGQGYGTNTQTQTTPGNPLASAMGGWQLGGQAQNWWNKNSGGGGGGNTSWFTGNSGMGD